MLGSSGRANHKILADFSRLVFTGFSPAGELFVGTQNSDRLTGPVVKASASGAEDPGFESRLRRDFSRSSHTSDLRIGTDYPARRLAL